MGETFATAEQDGNLIARVFNAATGEQEAVLRGHEYLVMRESL